MRPALLSLMTALLSLPAAGAGAAANETPRQLSASELDTWLEAPPAGRTEEAKSEAGEEAPPPAPRHHGLTIESGIGALGHLGPLKNVTPVSPWFHLQVGYEPLTWLAAFAEADMAFSTTSYAHSPPPPRTYRLYGFGGGLRGTLPIAEHWGLFAQGSAGAARVSEDVLEVYGYRHADELKAYFGGRLGGEWYPRNPHLAVSLSAGLRSYAQGLERERSSDSALCWTAGSALRYAF